ncbi:3D-(3,5/4)-trihydroxycyclohexane-1,2-dione acylhydrolase (decyclizing) [Chitinophagaceae bacterium LB-8]|uniref:3D-(3,5/4)-trihydroxycyclohexane-1,2-dione acylhydrolase (Decyclizing) n=1 Tax=Paraflavisolibacter caeni TaxID=2982496 RepID=A0A9X2XNR6_9BACT|nr:3D-(3,5/4)-trihydroxycyclohexane-1,2-dione acylhydrolase (decyclizing) [Paraflavisolibacter caeni]MCU7549433.1 3D-(3,5/4)-trihydroxycyclohexane-1,2-dione acylhydrolase (decyclizing) [Paraflavisolibacter caeni]
MATKTKRLTVAQATIEYLQNQFVERDGIEYPFFGGCFGIFGHGNVGGIGQALLQYPSFQYYQCRNEQAMVHTAIAYAKVKNRLGAFACTTSIGPGATNMVTGAATATINRIPVLLLPGDIFAKRSVDPVLQQLEYQYSNDISVNDCFKPVSKYWDRINRPEQLIAALPKAMRILTSPSETGAVTLALPQDVQAESYDFPITMFQKKVWQIQRVRPDKSALQKAADLISSSKRPVIIAGGGVIYSDACNELKKLVNRTGIPVVETYAGKGSLRFDELQNLGAAGVTGTPGAISTCQHADVVIGIGTRYSDFTSISQSAFQNPDVRFININVSEFDSFKQGALPIIGDAKETIQELDQLLSSFTVHNQYGSDISRHNQEWNETVDKIYSLQHGVPVSQGEVVGAVNNFSSSKDIVLCAAGSLPGDLHKLWRTQDSKGFHMEYGYSCMGYEIAGGLGAKMADPSREVYVMVGDGSYLMMAQEIATSIQEGYKITIILINNNGFASIGGLSRSLGSNGFGTHYKFRNNTTGHLDGNYLPVDLAANAESLGAIVLRTQSIDEFKHALAEAKQTNITTVIYIETDRDQRVDGYSWWEVPVAEVSTIKTVQESFERLINNKKRQRYHL